MTQVITATFVTVMLAALVTDVRSNRIPNALVVVGLGAALGLQALSGWSALANGALGSGLALMVTLPLFAMGAIGGGDAKLFVVVGAFMGPYGLLLALFASALVGGLLGLIVAARRRALLAVLVGCRDLVVNLMTLGRHGRMTRLGDAGAIAIPYGAAIALGSVLTWFMLLSGR